MPAFDFRYFEYDRLLRLYLRLFGTGNVLCLPFEQLVRDGPGFVSRIAAFADHPLDPEVVARLPFDEQVNRAASAEEIEFLRRQNKLGARNELNPSPILSRAAYKRIPNRSAPERAQAAGRGAPGGRPARPRRGERRQSLCGEQRTDGRPDRRGPGRIRLAGLTAHTSCGVRRCACTSAEPESTLGEFSRSP